MHFNHSFTVRAGQAEVADFHRKSSSLADITPPPIVTRVASAPERLADQDRMDFSLWLGPFPIRWVARICDSDLGGFTDAQEVGPFRHWRHRHEFRAIDVSKTEVVDTIDFSLRRHLVWGPIGLGMALSLPILFAFRGWKTRRLLTERPAPGIGPGGHGPAGRARE